MWALRRFVTAVSSNRHSVTSPKTWIVRRPMWEPQISYNTSHYDVGILSVQCDRNKLLGFSTPSNSMSVSSRSWYFFCQFLTKFPASYGIRRSNTLFTTHSHPHIIKCPEQTDPTRPHPFLFRSVLLTCNLRLGLPRILFSLRSVIW